MNKRHSKSRMFLPLLCLIFIIWFTYMALKRAEPVFVTQCSNYSNTAFTDIVNKCILKESENGEFGDYFKSMPGTDGKSAISADTAKINTMKSRLIIDIQNRLNEDYPAEVAIPLGGLSKLYILHSLGPQLHVKIIPVSIVNSELEEVFESAGINQVRYRLYLNISVDMAYRGYAMNEIERIETTVPIAETIISGTVPQYYGGFGALAPNEK